MIMTIKSINKVIKKVGWWYIDGTFLKTYQENGDNCVLIVVTLMLIM